MGKCYLLHFDPAYTSANGKGTAGHYLGYTQHLDQRIAHHQAGTGANLPKVARAAGSQILLVRTWIKADRTTERQLKKSKHHSRLCPLCNPGAGSRGKVGKQ